MGRWFSDFLTRLNRSLAAVYALLERPRAARRAVVGLLAVQTALLAYSAYVHSPTLNEPGHLVAGLSYWKFGRFDVYNVNPPLVKMVAALPVMAVGYEEDWSGFYTGLGARPEMGMGKDFVAANCERSFFLFMIARWACIPFSWLGGIVCYLWARDLYGRPAGVIACAIWSFEPNILAHASLMTPDAHATSLGVAACYTFWRWLKHPTWTQTLVTGVVLGLAELAKTTFILFYPLWPLLWLVYRWSDRKRMRLKDWLREGGMLAARMAIGLYVLNLGYGFEGSLKPLGEFQFVSNLLAGEELVPKPDHRNNSHKVSTITRNRFDGTWLGELPIPIPRNYVTGIDNQQSDFENRTRRSYLAGEWRSHGWWYYYLYATSIKVPLGLLLLGAAASFAITPSVDRRDTFILVAPPLAIFAIISMKTGINEHLRYAMVCFPCFFIWLAGFTRFFVDNSFVNAVSSQTLHRNVVVDLLGRIALVSFVWAVTSSLWIYPHSLSYFNELVGGPLNGRRHLSGSNLDWGQDLRYLKDCLEKDAIAGRQLWLAYSGFINPASFGIRFELPDGASLRPVGGQEDLVASVSFIQGKRHIAPDGRSGYRLIGGQTFSLFAAAQPARRIGYTLLIYENVSLSGAK